MTKKDRTAHSLRKAFGLPPGKDELCRALRGPDAEKCLDLIRRGADLDQRDPWQYTPLALACTRSGGSFIPVAETILAKGVDIDAVNQWGQTALMKAAEAGYAGLVKKILLAGADVNKKCSSGNTALSRAAVGGNLEVTRILLDAGADAFVRNKRGESALDQAKNPEVIEVLKARGLIQLDHLAHAGIEEKRMTAPLPPIKKQRFPGKATR